MPERHTFCRKDFPEKKKRVMIAGLGAMGSGIARLLLNKRDLVQVVGAGAARPDKQGKDLGEALGLGGSAGVTVTSIQELAEIEADIVIQATTSYTKEAFPDIMKFVQSGKNVISIAEEMSYPAVTEPDLAKEMDEAAKARGVTVLGTGVNPGFVLDVLILTLTGTLGSVCSIRASRINDLSPFGYGVMKTQGVGTDPQEFKSGLVEGNISGHIGFLQSVYMIADALGWNLDEVIETREPIISGVLRETPHVTVEPGMVAGCNHSVKGISNGSPVIVLEHPQQVHPHLEGVETGDYIHITGDSSSVDMTIKPEIPGGIGTISMAVNMIPHVLEAPAGLASMLDMPFPRAFMS